MVKVNGELFEIAGQTVEQFLESSDYDTRRIVVEINEEIVPKASYDKTVLCDGDTVEVVSFVGGG